MLKNIQPGELELGMKVVLKSEKYIPVETSDLKIMPNPVTLRGKARGRFNADKVRSDIFSGTVFTGYIGDFKQRYDVWSWKNFDDARHGKIRDVVIEEMSGSINLPVETAKEAIEKPWARETEGK